MNETEPMDELLALEEIERLHALKYQTVPAWTAIHDELTAKILELTRGLKAQRSKQPDPVSPPPSAEQTV